MGWRDSTSTSDRIFSALPYLIPVASGVDFLRTLIYTQPWLRLILSPLLYILKFFSFVFLAPPFLVFLILYFAVARNPRIPHFIRYNTVFALMADIAFYLVDMSFDLVMNLFGKLDLVSFFIQDVLTPVAGFMVLAICGYAIVQIVRGKYADVPFLSASARAFTQDG